MKLETPSLRSHSQAELLTAMRTGRASRGERGWRRGGCHSGHVQALSLALRPKMSWLLHCPPSMRDKAGVSQSSGSHSKLALCWWGTGQRPDSRACQGQISCSKAKSRVNCNTHSPRQLRCLSHNLTRRSSGQQPRSSVTAKAN